jgi:hypothetical protein
MGSLHVLHRAFSGNLERGKAYIGGRANWHADSDRGSKDTYGNVRGAGFAWKASRKSDVCYHRHCCACGCRNDGVSLHVLH